MNAGDISTLKVEDLHVHFRDICALRDITFEAQSGQAVAIVGRNGAGKSTFLKSLAGLIPNAAGLIHWDGKPFDKVTRRKAVAYLPQREEIDWSFPITVRGLVEMGLFPQVGTWGRFSAIHRTAVSDAIIKMGLEGLEKRRIGELSGGQQQRAFLARAIAGGARILLLDEPFAGLDREASQRLSDLLRDLAGSGALVFASHHDLKSIPETFPHTLLLRTKQLCFGPSAEVLTPENISAAFQ
tara:strand:- start:33963 stop:34685 length:723 start_codon:yes stop_codon:yes gene_type:complete